MIVIGGYVIDAAPVETHTLDSAVTDHPVEDGADVTDHVRVLPNRLTIEGIVSDTPIGVIAAVRKDESPFRTESTGGVVTAETALRFGKPSEDAFAFLKELRAKREPVRVETDIAVYENMILVGLSIPRSARTGGALHFRASFQEIVLVKTERTSISVAIPIVEKKSRLGAKTSKVVKDSKALERLNQQKHKMRKNWGLTYNPSIGTDLL